MSRVERYRDELRALRSAQVLALAPEGVREGILTIIPSRAEPDGGAHADLSNVVPFARRAPQQTPIRIAIVKADRPAPLTSWRQHRAFWSVLVGCSLLLHASVFAFFLRQQPRASIGVEVVSVELVLGDNNVAGNEKTPSPSTVSSPAASEDKPRSERTETARQDPEPAPEPVSESEPVTQASEAPSETPAAAPRDDLSLDKAPENLKPEIAPPATTPPVPAKKQPVAEKEPVAKKQRATKSARSENGKDARDRAPAPRAPSRASNGVARGSSEADSNYAGLVYAHLSRFLQRNHSQSGRTIVGFTVDAQGRATQIRLTKSSGVAGLDQAALATVARASPFPRPPSGQAQTFNAPLNFTVANSF